MKTTAIRTGIEKFICEGDSHGDHDHDSVVVCEIQDGTDPHTLKDDMGNPVKVDTVDPHGLKSVQYLTGGF